MAVPTSVPAVANGSVVAKSLQPEILTKPLSKSTRVGEVRLGAVMLALLKQYGITDEEIEAGLSSIAK